MGEGTQYFLSCGLAFGKQRSLPLALPLLRPAFAPQGEKEQELSGRWGSGRLRDYSVMIPSQPSASGEMAVSSTGRMSPGRAAGSQTVTGV